MTKWCANCLRQSPHDGGETYDESLCTAGGCGCYKYTPLNKGDLIVKFSGHMIIKKKDRPDDRGSVDHWLIQHLEDCAKKSESTDEAFDKLNLEYTLGESLGQLGISWGDDDE